MNYSHACSHLNKYSPTASNNFLSTAAMQIFHSFAELSKVPCPVHWAMGFFDGVHEGHRRVIESASTPGAWRGVITFMPHPLVLLRPSAAPALLTPHPEYKAELFRKLNVDVLLVLPFTAELAAMSPRNFIDTLCASCQVSGISVGENWHFGKGGSGDADFLQAEAKRSRFTACINPMLTIDGDTVCSTRIRHLLSEGKIKEVNHLLGRAFNIIGTVEHGQHLARQLGAPTANISLPPSAALPRAGVYAIQSLIDGRTQRGIANIGLRPTINEQIKVTRLEAHFPNWSGDLYGQQLNIELLRFIRPEIKFNSIDELRSRIRQDIAKL